MQLYIKNMVCDRCVLVVRGELDRSGLPYHSVTLGEIVLEGEPAEDRLTGFRDRLSALGFEVLDDARQKLIGKIKNVIIEEIHYGDADERKNFSEILRGKLHRDYSYLSNLFSEVEGITIEHFIINQKIEKAKELLEYNELTLSEIAFKLGYSSVAHLSAQFKKVTGLTPSHFKKLGGSHRKSLDKV